MINMKGSTIIYNKIIYEKIELPKALQDETPRKESAEHKSLMQFFAYEHLPPHLQEYSKPFYELATLITLTLPRNPERTVALRKLLEAKDCAVRAKLFK